MDYPVYLSDQKITEFIAHALDEDIANGDHSTMGSVPENLISSASLLIKDDGILAGVCLAEKIFQHYDPTLRLQIIKRDGAPIRRGDIAFIVEGPARSILSTERVVLNCMQRMSGIATVTQRLCKLIEGTGATLLDTRKTTPNFRLMEKWAVAIGGGQNHRIGLFDMVMLKDNHVDMAGGIATALQRISAYLKSVDQPLKVEIETRNLQEVEEVLAAGGADVIMLDNMKPKEIKAAVAMIAGRCQTEASGGITEDTIREIASCGVDYVSVGALTHSVKSLDLSLKVTTSLSGQLGKATLI